MIQLFEIALLAAAATGIAVFGARAVTAARFSRALRAYAEPVPLRSDVSPQRVPRQRAS